MSGGGFSQARLEQWRKVLHGHVAHRDVPGLVALVSRHGETHVEAQGTMTVGGRDPMRRDTIFRIASMTKPVVAVAAMMLVEDCVLRLDDPVDRWLPELADRRVLKSLEAELDDTVPAARPITLRDLLTFRMGLGAIMAPPGRYPIQRAMAEAGLQPGPNPSPIPPDEWMRRLGALPLVHQPGEGWLYHTGSDVLGVLIARAAGKPLEAYLRERLFEPLGMKDTGFHVPADRLDRLPASYMPDPGSGALMLHDDPKDSRWGRPPAFPSGGGGLVSTVDDYLVFLRMLLNGGQNPRGRDRLLSQASVELMTTNQLTPEQRAYGRAILGETGGWGLGMGVVLERRELGPSAGSFGWTGGVGTCAFADPVEDLVGVLMTQRMLTSPAVPTVMGDFWTATYQAVEA